MSKVTFEQFKQVEIRMGKVLECERVDGADKLLKLQVDFGDFKRQIISGIAESFSPEDLIKAGVVDPTKVVRTALENAVSAASMLLTTEAVVTDIPEKKQPTPMGGGMGMEDY